MKNNKMPELKPFDMVELFFDEDLRYIIGNEGSPGEDEDVYHLNEDEDIELESVTRIWRPNDKCNYMLIWERETKSKNVNLYLNKDINNKTNQELLIDNGYEDVVYYTNPSYEGALIGVSDDNRAIYDFDKMVKSLIESEGWDEFEAIEWIEYNTMRANPYFENSPIIMYPLEKEINYESLES